jgi:hypothetical protein
MTALGQQFFRPQYSTLPAGSLVDEECARPDAEPAHRREVTYQCPGLPRKSIPAHTFTVTVYFGAEEIPTKWDCRKHGAEGKPVKERKTFKPTATKEQQSQAKAKTPWDMLRENHPDESRGDAILADILQRLNTPGRKGRPPYMGVTEWLREHQRARGADPSPSFRP